jgi:hypothetical protein
MTPRPFSNVVAAMLRNAGWFVCGCGWVNGDWVEFLAGIAAAFIAGYALARMEDRI